MPQVVAIDGAAVGSGPIGRARGCPKSRARPSTCRFVAERGPACPSLALTLIYQMFAKLLGWMVLRTRSDAAKEIEILVLRHQLAVPQRRTPRPRMRWTDRAVIAALTRLVPARRRLGLGMIRTSITVRVLPPGLSRRWRS
jgi:hypothetical protein